MDTNPNWPKIIETVARHHGWSQARIARQVGTTQANIWRIASEKQSPRYELGARLIKLWQECQQEHAA